MNRAAGFLDKIYHFERIVAIGAFLVMTLVIIADVISRKTLGVGISGAPRVAVYAMIVTAFISLGLASHQGRHLRPKFADGFLPEALLPYIVRLQEGLTAVFFLVFTCVAILVVYETYLLQETSRMLRIVVWPMQSVIPIAFFVGAVRHGLYALYPEIRPQENSAVALKKGDAK